MADLADALPVEEEPDLSDLTIVTINVETREGRQLSMVWAAEGGRLALEPLEHVAESWAFAIVRRP